MMTKKSKIPVIFFVTMTVFMFSVILDINDKTSIVTIQVSGNDDRKSMMTVVTMTDNDDRKFTMTETTDKSGFVTFYNVPRRAYVFRLEMSGNTECQFKETLKRRIYDFRVIYPEYPQAITCKLLKNKTAPE